MSAPVRSLAEILLEKGVPTGASPVVCLTEEELATTPDAELEAMDAAAASETDAIVAEMMREPWALTENALDRASKFDHARLFVHAYGDQQDYDQRMRDPKVTRSELDYEHAALLAQYATRDPERIAAIMEASPHTRPKWKTQRGPRTLLEQTIARALKKAPDHTAAPIPKEPSAAELEPLRARSLRELLADPHASDPPPVVVPCLAWRGRLTLISATEGLGKSTLFSAAAAAVSAGRPFLGAPCTPGPVLWVLVEEHPSDAIARATFTETAPDTWHLLNLLGVEPKDRLLALEAEIQRVAPVLVVIDTLHSFASVDDGHQASEWQRLLDQLRALAASSNAAFLMSAQAVKATGDYRDSSAIGHLVDVVLTMHRDTRETTIRELERKKARFDLPLIVTVERTAGGYERMGGVRAAAATDRAALLEAMGSETWTAAKLAVRLGCSKDTVSRRLSAAGIGPLAETGPRGTKLYRAGVAHQPDAVVTGGGATI